MPEPSQIRHFGAIEKHGAVNEISERIGVNA
jgi:hypothetical protein